MNKRAIILLACLAVVVLVVILAAVVFTVRDIEVLVPDQWEEQFDKSSIVSASKIKLNSSIFSVSEKEAIKNIEAAVPYAKVITIERVFPSTVRINIVRREPIMAITLGEGEQIAIVDREFRVLEIVAPDALNEEIVAVLDGYNYVADSYELLGSNLKIEGTLAKVSEMVKACETVDIVNGKLPIFADRIDVSRDGYLVIRTVKGINISLLTRSNLTIADQFATLYNRFLSSDNKHDKSKYIIVTADGVRIITDDEYNNLTAPQ